MVICFSHPADLMKKPPKVGERYRIGGFVGECIEREDCVDENGVVTGYNTAMHSEQKPLCQFCKHAGAYTTDDVACCNCCCAGEEDEDMGQVFFEPYSFCDWLNELLRLDGINE